MSKQTDFNLHEIITDTIRFEMVNGWRGVTSALWISLSLRLIWLNGPVNLNCMFRSRQEARIILCNESHRAKFCLIHFTSVTARTVTVGHRLRSTPTNGHRFTQRKLIYEGLWAWLIYYHLHSRPDLYCNI